MFCHKCGVALPKQSSFCPACGTKTATKTVGDSHPLQAQAAPHPSGKRRTALVISGLCLLAVLLVAVIASHSNESSDSALPSSVTSNDDAGALTSSPQAAPIPTPAVVSTPEMPAAEREFIREVQDGRGAYQQAANEMAQGGTRSQRRSAVCRNLGALSVTDWVGQIQKLGSNSDGKGVLAISLADRLQIKTWNNDLSDVSDNTLIDPTSPLFTALSHMKEGDRVVLSGTFLPSDVDCVKESSLTLEGSMTDPEFVFRFTSVQKK